MSINIDTVKLKGLQNALGMTNVQLASEAGLHPGYIDHLFCREVKSVRHTTAEKLAGVLKTDMSEILC